MGRRSSIDKIPAESQTTVIEFIRAHRHWTLTELTDGLLDLGIVDISRSALHRYLEKLYVSDSLQATQEEGTIVTIMERATGEVRVVKCSASAQLVADLVARAVFPVAK